ncbi:MAG TPA: TerC/Alx family metal homeostasis membrane protein [Nocardioidaceae bacterium]|nr:TerC/Alx family metal homeostasis membrane protein [Nocardioidaceae bacterium]
MFTAVPPWVWAITVVGLVAIVVLDLLVIGRRDSKVSVRQATYWVVFYVSLAALFAVGLFWFGSNGWGSEFVAGYITEYSLSVDNLFVFVLIISRFGVPDLAEDKVLYIGIIVSLVLRAVLIAAGVAALSAATWVFYIFGAFLVFTAVRLLMESDDEDSEFTESAVVRGLRKVLPTTQEYVGPRLAVRTEGRWLMTPLVFAIAAIGIANVVFAFDSIPAIFGLTQHAYIVLTANAFALMGLRQLYFLLGGLLEKLVYLNIGLAVILAFIGLKLVFEALHGSHIDHLGWLPVPEVSIAVSLAFIVITLVVTAGASLGKTWVDERSRAS